MQLTSKRPYLFRGMYEWILDNQLTPHIVVDTVYPGVQVPPQYIEDKKITLNLAPEAVTGFAMNNTELEFKASFNGRLLHLYIPIAAIIAVYALENNHCLVFGTENITKGILVNLDEYDNPTGLSEEYKDAADDDDTPPPNRPKGPPKLSIVK
jgi:stringent starvation protein B